MLVNGINPFDPEWYKYAFDKYVSTNDMTAIIDEKIKLGYIIPDLDGSKSSVFRNDAILSNSFNEEKLRESLKDIYFNNSHRLIASNHDNVHFFQWNATFSDIVIDYNKNTCDIVLPTETFINAKERSLYKMKQYYRKWIDIGEILNDWRTFKWNCLLFINQRIYSDYKLHIDDRETIIRFKYYNFWVKQNYPIYVFKFDTNYQTRIKISKELVMNQWNYKMPIEYIGYDKIELYPKVMACINKISNVDERIHKNVRVDVLGDNIEFLNIHDGYLDLSTMSRYNKGLIESEREDFLYMSIFIPKFLHEFPILLPCDNFYRPYEPDLLPVITYSNKEYKKTRTNHIEDEIKQVYIDENQYINQDSIGWHNMIRPIVLSDAFINPEEEPNLTIGLEISELRKLVWACADIVEKLRLHMREYNESVFDSICDELEDTITKTYNCHNDFLNSHRIELNTEYTEIYNKFVDIMKDIRIKKDLSLWFNSIEFSDMDFFYFISSFIIMSEKLVKKYYLSIVISGMGDNRILWENVSDNLGKLRFQRPIECNDFWTFEYDVVNNVWRPYILDVEYRFPDVYLLSEYNDIDIDDRIFKAFFFYSDTTNIINQSSEVEEPSRAWDDDINKYVIDRNGIYRDIFMEKFYWLAIKSIYKGLLQTNSRWEIIEYVINNDSYDRFNELFLNTIDPYFKMGLINYIKDSNFCFPFDAAISKLEESINKIFLNYKQVTNFEIYLNKTWLPSYFDYLIDILNDWEYENRIISRPRNSLDIGRIKPISRQIHIDLIDQLDWLKKELEYIISKLKKEGYNLDIDLVISLYNSIVTLQNTVDDINSFSPSFDMNLYSTDDVECMKGMFQVFVDTIRNIDNIVDVLYNNIQENNIYEKKESIMISIRKLFDNDISKSIIDICNVINNLDMQEFMRVSNDLETYFNSTKYNPNDRSLLGYINKFKDDWTYSVKNARTELFTSIVVFMGDFIPDKSYSREDISIFVDKMNKVSEDIDNLERILKNFYRDMRYEEDIDVLDKIEYVKFIFNLFKQNTDEYIKYRNIYIEQMDTINNKCKELNKMKISKTEKNIINDINDKLEDILFNLSYIAGKNNALMAQESYSELDKVITRYEKFIEEERDIFGRLIRISRKPNMFIDTILSYVDISYAIIDYLDYMCKQKLNHDPIIRYIDIYTTDEIEISNGGFKHRKGDSVFIPNVGSYKIESISGNIEMANSLEPMNYRNTQFRDPTIQSDPYDSVTNGPGLGISVVATKSNRIKIINDSILKTTLDQVKSIIRQMKDNVVEYNINLNNYLSNYIVNITDLDFNFDNIKTTYGDHMTESISDSIEDALHRLNELKPQLNDLMNRRESINIRELINSYEDFISYAIFYLKTVNNYGPNIKVYENRMNSAFNKLYEFYGAGRSWRDKDRLITLINDLKYEMELFNRKVLNNINDEKFDDCREIYEKVINIIININQVLFNLPELISELVETIESIENDVDKDYDFRIDKWYRMTTVKVADGGSGYKIGDIVEIIPEIPTSINYDKSFNDVLMNDVLLLQVTDVNNGVVVNVQPLLNYALPYLLWGSRRTFNHASNGSGLIVNVFTYELELTYDMIFNTYAKKYKFDIDENDIMTFRFDNPHNVKVDYEVFFSGKQTTDFNLRRFNEYDVLYLNALDVLNISNSSVHIDGEHHLIYKLDDIEILDSGAGYYLGQEIYIATNYKPIKVKVMELTDDNMKGVAKIEIIEGDILYEDFDPKMDETYEISNDMNNIDDEFNSNIRNENYMYSEVNMPNGDEVSTNGDPDGHWYLGERIDNSFTGDSSDIWHGIVSTIDTEDGIIPDKDRTPPNQSIRGEYQLIGRECFHSSPIVDIEYDEVVNTYSDIPTNINLVNDIFIYKKFIVNDDENNRHHKTLYKLRSLSPNGHLVYFRPLIVDEKWNKFRIDWKKSDYYQDLPTEKPMYLDVDWYNNRFEYIENEIDDFRYDPKYNIDKHLGTFIFDLCKEDISVYNFTMKRWEDMSSDNWILEVDELGFTLSYNSEDEYCYDMILYLNKTPSTQIKNCNVKRQAKFRITSTLIHQVFKNPINSEINICRNLRIRKLFSYNQAETFIVGNDRDTIFGYEMDFKINNYPYFRNQILLSDIKIYNKSAGRFEDLMDTTLFEVRFKDPKSYQRGTETQSKISEYFIIDAGIDFVDGNVWCYNEEFDIFVFGIVSVDIDKNGSIKTFKPIHCPNIPQNNISLEFFVYQGKIKQNNPAKVIISFQTETIEVFGDGYIHNVTNPYAPVPEEFKVICLYELDQPIEYEISICKVKNSWKFSLPKWTSMPLFHIEGYSLNQNNLYVLSDVGRYPLINPVTGNPFLSVIKVDNGTDIRFMSLYRKYSNLEIHCVPYSMESVYFLRDIPKHGYIDLTGQINKPLNKKYFEFWVNGRLLYDEITIISPTKLFLHGLKSLKNFEIVEINRDPNEYFADIFLDHDWYRPKWNYSTYIDDALTGNLKNDNYTLKEQEYFLTPVYPQVDEKNIEFKNYPPNVDIEKDIICSVEESDHPLTELRSPNYKYTIINIPKIQSIPLSRHDMTFSTFNFIPMSNDEIVDMLNEEWKDEIQNGLIPEHRIISNEEWFGIAARLYDEYGSRVYDIKDAVYRIVDNSLLEINTTTKTGKIIPNNMTFDID